MQGVSVGLCAANRIAAISASQPALAMTLGASIHSAITASTNPAGSSQNSRMTL